ncbi:MAG: CDP-alcohol phosphatidyltransferase family protein [Clostridia bacterium]|nr:CDP-alcohol phosphatidyltransferase family protein [Clostridia bacterium]
MTKRINAANIVTSIRILLSAALLFFPALSMAFNFIYIACGVSDMIDGAIARKTNNVSAFGAKFDTFADIIFVAVCMIKILPVLSIPSLIYIWVAVIAIMKILNLVTGFIKQKKFIAVHSVMNKVTGMLLFLFPLTLPFIDLKYTLPIVCTAATIAAIWEGYLIRTTKTSE